MDKILSEYLIARESNGKTSHTIAHFITKEFTKILMNILGRRHIHCSICR